jgi:long-chain fatty acid transport protein
VDKIGITTGFSYRVNDKIDLDLSFLFIEGKKRYDQNLETEFAGTYKSRAFIPGIGLSIYL